MNKVAQKAKTRTFLATLTDTEYGVIRSITRNYVTLTRDHSGNLSAVVDGENVEYSAAIRILENATRTEVLEEAYLPLPTIGKAKARALHIELGRLGHKRQYELAAEVLGREVPSFAALTEEEAIEVRSYGYGVLGYATGSVAV